MKRLPGSGIVTVTGPASRSNTASEYNVSRFGRTMRCLSTGTSSRRCVKLPKPPASTIPAKFLSDSARLKLSAVTATPPVCAEAAVHTNAIAANETLAKALSSGPERRHRSPPPALVPFLLFSASVGRNGERRYWTLVQYVSCFQDLDPGAPAKKPGVRVNLPGSPARRIRRHESDLSRPRPLDLRSRRSARRP